MRTIDKCREVLQGVNLLDMECDSDGDLALAFREHCEKEGLPPDFAEALTLYVEAKTHWKWWPDSFRRQYKEQMEETWNH